MRGIETGRKRRNGCGALLALALACPALPALAESIPSLGQLGYPGLIDMPTGETMPDGAVSITASGFGPLTRATLSFQITPWLSGSMRVSNFRHWYDVVGGPGDDDGYSTYTDRSFDLRLRLLEESRYLPAVTLGLQDVAGTGLQSAEYLAATKTFGGRLKVTAGLGWGRLGSYHSMGSPFGSRPDPDVGEGSRLNAKTWFRGPMAAFGGLEWKIDDRWTVKAEYSSDAYALEAGSRKIFKRRSPFNFGIEYQQNQYIRAGLYSLYGSELGFTLQVIVDPKERTTPGVLGAAPVALGQRPSRALDPDSYDGGWVTQPDADRLLRKNLDKYLGPDGIYIEDFAYTAERVQIRIRNTRIDAGAQAIGRTARALSHVMPASVEVFEIVPVVSGMAASKITIRRSDLEALEHAPQNDALLRERVVIGAAEPSLGGSGPDAGLYPDLSWRIRPGFRVSDPLRGDIGLRLKASYTPRPGLIFAGSIYGRLAENHDKISRPDEYTGLQPVRSDIAEYNRDSRLAIERLTVGWYAHPSDDLYTRVTVGLLEPMHAGVSGEVLWKRADSPFALGLELNYTRQRDTDQHFGFGQYDYSVVTGHVSAYYDFGNGYLGQLDVGRYLAGDVGATISLDREFANGWRIGGFATFTDASTEDFGEGSFDKGIRITMPMNWLLGRPSRETMQRTFRPLQRDGGARVDVEGRLYDLIRNYHTGRLDDQWSRVWR